MESIIMAVRSKTAYMSIAKLEDIMRNIICLLVVVFGYTHAPAQKTTGKTEILSAMQVSKLFTDPVRKTLNIRFPILRVYKYADKTGQYYCILTESRDEITTEKDTVNFKIKAVNVKFDKNSFTKTWEINDNTLKETNDEQSIWFWTKYIEFKDYDNDGLVDPIIIYGTSGSNGYDDGRIKFIIYYKKQKIAIRHQNGVLDFERETQVDKAFYNLPPLLQAAVRKQMEMMTKNNQAIFPAGWQLAMKNKKTIINEKR